MIKILELFSAEVLICCCCCATIGVGVETLASFREIVGIVSPPWATVICCWFVGEGIVWEFSWFFDTFLRSWSDESDDDDDEEEDDDDEDEEMVLILSRCFFFLRFFFFLLLLEGAPTPTWPLLVAGGTSPPPLVGIP